METSKEGKFDPESLELLLPVYYKHLFPYGLYYRWLNYGGLAKNYFNHREFSFTLKDDIYLRFLSFSDLQEFEKSVKDKCPHKIDIGAVYNFRPKDRRAIQAGMFQPQEKELVFDIDMSDYDDVRYCCSGTDICRKCWPLMQIAVRVIDTALEEDFDFMHRLWVYSGRRGIHCWVCDASARALGSTARAAIAEYLSVVRGAEKIKKVSLGSHTHPSVERAISLIRPSFEHYALDMQDFLGDEDKMKKVAALVPLDNVRQQLLADDFLMGESSLKRWNILRKRLNMEAAKPSCTREMARCADEIMLQYCYPRLDINVSKGLNHLLKAPFCVHPKTGRVCVPFDVAALDSFDPFEVPRVDRLADELNMARSTDAGAKKGVKMTSLQTGVAVFERFLDKLDESSKQLRQQVESKEF